jgi:hypothetical protein
MPHALPYEAPSSADLQVEQRADGGVTITIPTRRRSFARVFSTVSAGHPLAFLLAPPVWLAIKLLATRRPRATIQITADEVVLAETSDEGLGYRTSVRRWPRAAVTEFRPNRYVNGLYVRVRGQENFDALTDLPPDTIREIAVALAAAQTRLGELRNDDIGRE